MPVFRNADRRGRAGHARVTAPRRLAQALVAAGALASLSQVASAQTTLPANAKPTCIVSAVEFAGWFTSGSVTANGAVDPANSVTFPDVPNCSFYKWSQQMFLWLTSPVPRRYGGGTHVFNSPVFYDVSPPAADGSRTLTPNAPGRIRIFDAAIPQLGPLRQPVGFDKDGRRFNIVRPEFTRDGKLLARNKAGQTIAIGRTQFAPTGKPLFFDQAGKAIDIQTTQRGAPILRDKLGKAITLTNRRVVLGGKLFILDTLGNAIPTEQGQADGSVLMAQNNSLVYYALQVNDVFAYMLTGTKNGGITPAPTLFPTTPADLNKIEAFALAHSKTLPDAIALAVELKSAWIETTGIADLSKFVTTTATIPVYDKSNPAHWVKTGTKTATLAMVGMHVVGSTKGHPEMIWATYEHVGNTRNAAYSYTNNANATVNVPQNNNDGPWLFSTTPATATPNVPRMFLNGADIDAIPGDIIGPSDVLRVSPWGRPGSATSSNTEVIAINNSVINQLAAGDVRKNYIMTGSTWTAFGTPPGPGNQVGTNRLANTTMETFFQPSNCFDCHTGNMLGTPGGGGLSHIWGPIKPLFP
jgi:hypothetical protein